MRKQELYRYEGELIPLTFFPFGCGRLITLGFAQHVRDNLDKYGGLGWKYCFTAAAADYLGFEWFNTTSFVDVLRLRTQNQIARDLVGKALNYEYEYASGDDDPLDLLIYSWDNLRDDEGYALPAALGPHAGNFGQDPADPRARAVWMADLLIHLAENQTLPCIEIEIDNGYAVAHYPRGDVK